MPEAAWCSACQKYVWVTPEGRCQLGHGPEFLSARYVDDASKTTVGGTGATAPATAPALAPRPSPPPPERTPHATRNLLILIAAIASVLIGGLVVAAWITFDSAVEATSNLDLMTRSQNSETNTHINSGSRDREDVPSATDAPAKFTPMTVGEWDAYIAKEYPGYRVKERIETPDQWRKGLLGVNYVLVNEKQPKFTLLVTLTQLKADQELEDVPDGFLDVTGDIATSDGLFSAEMARYTSYLSGKAQDAIINSYVAEKPDATAVVFGGFGDEGTVNFGVATGTQAVARTIRSFENWDYVAESPIPSGPDNATVDVAVSPL